MTKLISEANLKFLSILVTVIIGVGGLIINFYKLQQSIEMDARRPFLERQLATCFEATNSVAMIAAHISAQDGGENPVDAYRRLYLGTLALVEDRGVACAMTRFNKAYNAGLENKTVSMGSSRRIEGATADCPEKELTPQAAALEVAKACRKLILRSWEADLPVDSRG